jgi:butyryl-CoA dehydrogenase
MAGYEASLEYARTRRQGRRLAATGKDASQPQVPIIEHPDVRRMLLAQKAYVEGGLALILYCARLVDDKATGSEVQAHEAAMLLEVLTPIAKSWPSEWCLEANSLAIQVHGGYGYTRDYPVEQYWRDNRLNMIHEGTHGIQALDLLGRKVRLDDGHAFELLMTRITETAERASSVDGLTMMAAELKDAVDRVVRATHAAWRSPEPEEVLANAVPYMQAFGHVVIAWLWLDVALVAYAALRDGGASVDSDHLNGKLQSARYFFGYELPKIGAWLHVVEGRNLTCLETREEWLAS